MIIIIFRVKAGQLQTIVNFLPYLVGYTQPLLCVYMCVCVCVCFVSSLQANNHHLHNVKRFAWKHWPAKNLVPEQSRAAVVVV